MRAEQCARTILDVVPATMRLIRRETRRAAAPQISIPQFRSLALLRRQPGASLSDVADHLGVTRPTASVLVGRLVGRGLVERRTDPEERRRIRLTLTAEGSSLLEAARGSAVEAFAAALQRLSAEEVKALGRGLSILEKVVAEVTEAHGQ